MTYKNEYFNMENGFHKTQLIQENAQRRFENAIKGLIPSNLLHPGLLGKYQNNVVQGDFEHDPILSNCAKSLFHQISQCELNLATNGKFEDLDELYLMQKRLESDLNFKSRFSGKKQRLERERSKRFEENQYLAKARKEQELHNLATNTYNNLTDKQNLIAVRIENARLSEEMKEIKAQTLPSAMMGLRPIKE